MRLCALDYAVVSRAPAIFGSAADSAGLDFYEQACRQTVRDRAERVLAMGARSAH